MQQGPKYLSGLLYFFLDNILYNENWKKNSIVFNRAFRLFCSWLLDWLSLKVHMFRNFYTKFQAGRGWSLSLRARPVYLNIPLGKNLVKVNLRWPCVGVGLVELSESETHLRWKNYIHERSQNVKHLWKVWYNSTELSMQ